MKKHVPVIALAIMLASLALAGCSSTAAKADPPAVLTAKQEMRRRGWKRIEVDRCVFRDGLWFVELHTPKSGKGWSYVCVRVAQDGTVVHVFQNLE
jgi:hypothetical protein